MGLSSAAMISLQLIFVLRHTILVKIYHVLCSFIIVFFSLNFMLLFIYLWWRAGREGAHSDCMEIRGVFPTMRVPGATQVKLGGQHLYLLKHLTGPSVRALKEERSIAAHICDLST